jgi:hypothetical protein
MQEAGHSCKDFLTLIGTPDLPGLEATPRAGRLSLPELNRKLERFITETRPPAPRVPCLRSAALLWHDYLDESHTISQEIRTADGSFLHAIMHRREPDYNNAKYWFRRVGTHPSFARIAARAAGPLATDAGKNLVTRLAPQGNWNPFAFVDACEEAADRSSADPTVRALMLVQQVEFNCLLEHLFDV